MPRRFNQKISITVGFILLIFGISLAIPAMIAAETGNSNQIFVELEENEIVSVYRTLNATMEIINPSNVTVELRDRQTGEINTTTIGDGETETLTVRGFEIEITIDIITSSLATLEISHPNVYGFSDSVLLFFDNIILIIMLGALSLIVGVLLLFTGKEQK